MDDVRHIIMRSSTKSCSLDPEPTSLIVKNMDETLPVITLIINSSLQSGHFPEVWKEAIVKPLLKKCKSDSSKFKNLLPASNLSHISKFTESVVADQIQSHLAKNNLYPVFQSAYWKLHSRETALAKVRNDILTNMNKHPRSVRLECCLGYCGPKYFVNTFKILKLGLNGTALSWFCSYLSGSINEYLFRERFQMYFIFLIAFPKDRAYLPFYLTSKISKMSVVTFQKFIVRQMTLSFIYRLTQAVLLVKMRQLDKWNPVSQTLSSGSPRIILCLMATNPNSM